MPAKYRYPSHASQPRTRKKPLAEAVGTLVLGMAMGHTPARAELPVPASVLVSPGHGSVLPPVVNGNTMTIRQRSDRAILDWQSFNIGSENTVRFQQPSSTSVALNNIHQADPSRILGTLTANGQVYLVNQNGFLFGQDARVNVNTLVATTLDISDDALKKGLSKVIVKNGDAALTSDGGFYRTDGQGNTLKDAQGQSLKREILIENGAKLRTPSGGRIMIFAPSVVNKGSISTPDGQTLIAAATDKVYLQEADSTKTGVRGLLVEVGTGGSVDNLGRIAARRGNITLEGFAVNQEGVVSATTSVRLNGSIRLLAREKGTNPVLKPENQYVLLPDSTRRDQDNGDKLGTSAKVVLGQGSVTKVMPEVGNSATAVDDQTQDPSQIEIMGRQVQIQSAARLAAPSGKVSVTATLRPDDPSAGLTADPEATIDIQPGARIDVSGIKNVKVPVSKNIVEVELRSYELRDSPLQKDKNGALYGKKVYVDIRDSQNGKIPLADISGSIARIERNVAERSVKGGSIALSSAGNVNVGQGSTLDVSGGSTRYQGGFIKTTELSSGGRYYDIGKASPNRIYDGILGQVTRKDEKWNVTQSWDMAGPISGGRYEPGYVQGADGGSVDIRADHLSLNGDIEGKTIDGQRQRETGQRAIGSSLTIDLGFDPTSTQPQPVAFLAENRDIGEQLRHLSATMSGLMQDPLVIMDRYLERAGIRDTRIITHGAIVVAEGANIVLPETGGASQYKDAQGAVVNDAQGNPIALAGGGLSLIGGQVEFQGRITAPSGQVQLQTQFDVEGLPDTGVTGGVHLAAGSRIDVSGRWTNDLPLRSQGGQEAPILPPVMLDGGKVMVAAKGDVGFDAGSEIAADGGAWVNANGKLSAGKGGDIAFSATMTGRNPVTELSSRLGSNLAFGGLVHAYALNQGGTLALTSNQILVGDTFSSYPTPSTPAKPNELSPLVLDPALFRRGGFRAYALTADLNGIDIGYDTTLRLQSENWVLGGSFQKAPTGTAMAALGSVQVLDDSLRKPVDLSLAVKQPNDFFAPDQELKVLKLDTGSQILGDPGANIGLQADGRIVIDGRISAPAGKIQADIKIHGKDKGYENYTETAFDASQGIFLGAGASLEAPGAVLPTSGGIASLRDDRVLDGGTVALNANRGYIVLDPQSRVDVSGANAVVDQAQPSTNQPGFQAVPLSHASKGGSIALSAAEGMMLDGALLGRSRGAEGGGLSVSLLSDRALPTSSESLKNTFPTGPRIIEIRQTPKAWVPPDDWTVGQDIPGTRNGLVSISAQQVAAGGFGSLWFHAKSDQVTVADGQTSVVTNGQIRFVDSVNLGARRQIVLDSPILALTQSAGQGASSVQVAAPFVSLGSSETREQAILPGATTGPGSFAAVGRDLELVGGLSLQGAVDTHLLAERDFRLRGVSVNTGDGLTRDFTGRLQASGNLTLAASQIYPSTLSQYSIVLGGDNPGRLTVLGGDRPAPVLSAGGKLSLEAPDIDIAGTLKAPFGKIELAAASGLNLQSGAVVSVSVERKTIPFGIVQGGLDWLYPLGSGINLLYGVADGNSLPARGIQLTGATVNLATGAKVDISGGGQLYAHEFLKGSGGSVDLLDPSASQYGSNGFSYRAKYAIVPWLKDRLAPYDPYETPKYTPSPSYTTAIPFAAAVDSSHSLNVGDSITLADSAAGLSAGKYTLLPASYALLPGAYLVTPDSDTANAQPGEAHFRLDGVPVVAGRLSVSGTPYADFGWQGFAVQSGRDFRKLTDYGEYTADSFFAAQAKRLELSVPTLPRDASRLVIDVTRQLDLDGEVKGDPGKGGHGGQLDIAASNLRVAGSANTATAVDGEVLLRADQLNKLNVESMLLGGVREDTTDGQNITVRSGAVVVESGAQVKAPEIMLAANNRVEVGAGAELKASGKITQGPTTLKLTDQAGTNSDGAFLRVSAGGQVDVLRPQTVTGHQGTLDVAAGATLGASGSMTADATGATTVFAGTVEMTGGSLSLGAVQINLGEGSGTGLTLTGAQLSGLSVDELILRSASEVRLYGPVALATKTLDIRAAGLVGHANAGGAASLSADEIDLSNPHSASLSAATGTDGGSLALTAKNFNVKGGDFAIQGYGRVDIAAGERFSAKGQGGLAVGGDVGLTTPLLTAEAGADYTLDASGHAFALAGPGASATPAGAGLGAKFAIRADSIDLNSRVALPSGIFAATADHALTLGAGATLDMSGTTQTYAGKTVATPGGSVVLASSHGDAKLAAGALIDVSARDHAGSFGLAVPEGSASLEATLKGDVASATGTHADLAFDIGRLTDGGAGAFAYLRGVGGAHDFSLRSHRGDVLVGAGSTLKAQTLDLSADTGSLTVAGTLDAAGTTAGSISLAAGDKVHLASTAQLLAGASADNERGGSVSIESVDRDNNGVSGIAVDAGALIDVRGGALKNPAATPGVEQTLQMTDGPTVTVGGTTYLAGDIHLRALRQGNGVAIDYHGNAQGATEVDAEAVRVYNASTIGSTEIATWQQETQAYMNSVNAAAHPGLTLLPGLEIRSAGNLALGAEGWDFMPTQLVDQPDGSQLPEPTYAWRYGADHALPGVLTLRAEGDISLAGKLSDGVAPGHYSDGSGGQFVVNEAIQPGRSWSFKVVAGADAKAADPLRTVAGTGNIDLAAGDSTDSGTVGAGIVRTGTGSIDLAAGGSLRLGGESSAIYTVGQVDTQHPFGSQPGSYLSQSFWAQYPTRGGHINIAVGGNIVGAPTRQFMSDWLVRTGSLGDNPLDRIPVAWGVALDQSASIDTGQFNLDPRLRGFKQNIGALAGGNIAISAGGRITDLSVVMPTVGKQVGERVEDSNQYAVVANQVEVHGGGRLGIKSGGDIAGGLFYVEKGAGSIVSGGAITGGQQFTAGPLFALGDASLDVLARGNLEVGTVFNAFLLKERGGAYPTDASNYFSTYSDSSRVGFESLVGDVTLANDVSVVANNYVSLDDGFTVLDSFLPLNQPGAPVLYYYPGTLSVHAYSGSIAIERSMVLAPTATGNLELFADRSIQSAALGDNLVDVNMSDVDPANIPSVTRPVTDLGALSTFYLYPGGQSDFIHAQTPVHSGDSQPVLIATHSGDFRGNDILNFYLPKSVRIEVGRDMRDVNFDIQNLDPADISQISAQRDIAYTILRDSNGGLANGQNAHLRVSGPGTLQVLAGRNIDLGSSDGVTSIGNARNPALPMAGASLTLLAGLSDKLDLAGFLRAYLKKSDADISAMTPLQQLEEVLPVFFAELRKSGVDAAKNANQTKYYNPGYQAIKTLFPGDKYQGDIDLFFSRIQTLANGGINLLTPGGLVNAGLTNSSLGQKTSDQLGVVAQQAGAINAYVKTDFTVNESRVFTLGGGDITIWASEGNIDAGRGAKSALTAPPPQVVFDANGNPQTIFPPVVSGSGIRTATSDSKTPAGNVYLFAPKGIVDAGDAGIGGSNVVIAATAVIGASNIQVSGTAIGVPSAAPPPVVPAGAAGAAAAAAKSASQQVDESGSKNDTPADKASREALRAALQTIQVDLMGFGNCTFDDVRHGREGCGS